MAGVGAGYSFLTLVLVRSASASCVAPASPISLKPRSSSFTLVLVRAQRVSEQRRARIVNRVVAEVSTLQQSRDGDLRDECGETLLLRVSE